MKNTAAPLLVPVAVTVTFWEHVSTIGGYEGGFTVTVKLQLVEWPQVSLADTNTVVRPSGKVLPLGGLALTNGGGLQPPLAVTLKKTVAPLELAAVTVRLDEQFRTSGGYEGGFTVTVKLQLVELPQVSLADTNTVVMPSGKVLPLGGLALTNGGGLQPPLAVTLKKTAAPLELAAVTVRLDEQFRTSAGYEGGFTVTVKLQALVSPQLSFAVAVTVVVPIGNVLPLGGKVVTVGGGKQPPLAVTE